MTWHFLDKPVRSFGSFSSKLSRLLPYHARHTASSVKGADVTPETHWPDGTPKRFRGNEAWKNWINWDAPFRDQTDELNRQRHFFWEVDHKGALWKLELHRPGERDGQMRHMKVLDAFFGNVQPNKTGYFEEAFPFVSLRTHEHYFVRWACTKDMCERSPLEAPIVFNDLRDGELRYMMAGEIARSISTRFEPTALRLTADGRLLHPVCTTSRLLQAQGGKKKISLLAALDGPTAQTIFMEMIECPARTKVQRSEFVLHWNGAEVPLLRLENDL